MFAPPWMKKSTGRLNTGEVVSPLAVSPFANSESNERNTAVIFGE